MPRSSIRITTFRRLASKGDVAPTLLLLMMALNDLTLTNDALEYWHGDLNASRANRQVGAKMYFVRLRLSHIFEALKIIENIRDTPALRAAVDQCDQPTQASFERVVNFIGSEEYKFLVLIRNNITFHYSERRTQNALREIAGAWRDLPLTISMGELPIDWYFEPGDRIVDRIVVRNIFNIPAGADVRPAVDEIVNRLHDVIAIFADFAGYFIRHHTGRV